MGMPNKSITDDEKSFIQNKSLEGWTDDKLAKALNRNIKSIRKIRKDLGIVKGRGGTLKIDKNSVAPKHDKTSNISDFDKLKIWESDLKSSARYRRLLETLNESEMLFFIEQWTTHHLQFENMTVSEENMLEQMIMLQIRIHDNHKMRKDIKQYEEEFRRRIQEKSSEALDLEDEDERLLHEMIMSNNTQLQNLNKELKDLTDKLTTFQKALNATREQREAKETIGADTVISLIRKFNKEEERQKAGRLNELMKKAMERKLDEFKEPYHYADNVIEPVIMMGSDYVEEAKKEKEKENE